MPQHPLLQAPNRPLFLAVVGLGAAGQAAALWYWGGLLPATALGDALLTWLWMAVMALVLAEWARFYRPRQSLFWWTLALPILPAALYFLLLKMLLVRGWYPAPTVTNLYPDLPLRTLLMYGGQLLSFSFVMMWWGRQELQQHTRQQQNAEALAREAELHKLRHQLQPHFLFNALNSVNALVGRQPEQAREMIDKLAQFYRATLRHHEEQLVPLAEEWQRLEQYLAIEQVRFGHRLQVTVYITHCLDFPVPPLLLQPLIENAIKHGLYGTTEPVHIRLEGAIEEPNLQLQLCNPFDATQPAAAPGSGFGLTSVKRRLALLYGRRDLLRIQKNNDQFCIQLTLPRAYDQSTADRR